MFQIAGHPTDELAADLAVMLRRVGLVGAVLAEQHDEWAEMRRYIGLDILAKFRLTVIDCNVETTAGKETTTQAISA